MGNIGVEEIDVADGPAVGAYAQDLDVRRRWPLDGLIGELAFAVGLEEHVEAVVDHGLDALSFPEFYQAPKFIVDGGKERGGVKACGLVAIELD